MSAAPKRRRPGGTSPIALVPRVEEIRISPSEDSPAPAPEAPARPTPADEPSPEPTAAVPTEPEPAPEPTPQSRSKPTSKVGAQKQDAAPERISRSFKFDEDQIQRAETAVLRTSALEGGYRSMVALMNSALERELQRLARKFNDGEAFPPNNGDYRHGRPIGR